MTAGNNHVAGSCLSQADRGCAHFVQGVYGESSESSGFIGIGSDHCNHAEKAFLQYKQSVPGQQNRSGGRLEYGVKNNMAWLIAPEKARYSPGGLGRSQHADLNCGYL